MKIFYFNLLLILICPTVNLIGQNFSYINTNFDSYYYSPQNLGFSTPQTAEFAKYGNTKIDHYNGLLNLEISIYEYKDNDFQIPISIKYNSEGFKPNKRPSIVGYNWILDAGGVITREVVGSPDDVKGNYTSSDGYKYMLDGLLVALRNNTYKYYTKPDLWNLALETTKNGNPYLKGDVKYDYAPDIFTFRFGKHSGKFIIGNDGKAVSLSNDGYIIDITGLTIQQYSTTATVTNSIIKITAPDGLVYTFGGSSNYLEYSIPNNPKGAMQKPVFINSWHINSITAQTGKVATFTYNSVEQKNKYKYYVQNQVSSRTETRGDDGYYDGGIIKNTPYNGEIEFIDRVFTPMLNKITIDKTEIIFNSSAKYSFYPNETINDVYALSSIDIKYATSTIQRHTFSFINNGAFLFLDKLILNAQSNDPQNYIFQYKSFSTTWPFSTTTSIDHWGFWKGGQNTTESTASYLENIINNKSVNTSVFDTGLLKKIIYPTGGYSEFTYEYNRYTNYKEKDTNSLHYKDMTTVDPEPCGGARIYKITDYDPVSSRYYNTRTFTYINPSTGKECGTIGLAPVYKTFEQTVSVSNTTTRDTDSNGNPKIVFLTYTTTNTIINISSNTLGGEEVLGEYHIGYPYVTETFSDGSSIFYTFSSLLDIPDDEDISTKAWTTDFVQFRSINQYQFRDKYGLYKMNSLARFRGKLLKKITYSPTKVALLTETYKYNIDKAKDMYDVTILTKPNGFIANKIFLVPCQLLQYQSMDNNGIKTIVNSIYNSKNLLSSEEIIGSNNESYILSFKYPCDFTGLASTDNVKIMTDKNIINEPVEILKSIKATLTSEGKATEGIKYDYKSEKGRMLRDNLYCLQTDIPTNLSAVSGKFVKRQTFNVYDIYGNPVAVTKGSNKYSVYIWGYRGLYLLAEIKNATYEQVKTALGGILPESLSVTDSPDYTQIENLRIQLADAHVTTFKYNPLIGRTETTDPSGIKTYFGYDKSNRLAFKKNHTNNFIERYSYKHYSTTNTMTVTGSIGYSYCEIGKVYSTNLTVGNGSGSYMCRWILKDVNGNILRESATSGLSNSYTFSQQGKMLLTCIVEDLNTGMNSTCLINFTVVKSVISFVKISASSQVNVGSIQNATVAITGGSGNYTYAWKAKIASNSEIISTANTSTFSIAYETPTSIILECIVTDVLTGQTYGNFFGYSVEDVIRIINPSFTNVSATTPVPSTASATIYCPVATTLTFKLTLSNNANTSTTAYFIIYNKSFSLTGTGTKEQTVTVEVPKGNSSCTIQQGRIGTYSGYQSTAICTITSSSSSYAITYRSLVSNCNNNY